TGDSYDRQKAVDFAMTYCCNPKPEICPVQKNKNGEEEDCTNFASQVLLSGGFFPTEHWYCGTYAWVNVNGFYDYLIQSNLARKCELKDLQPGDFIQYNEKYLIVFDNWHHTAVVIEKGNNPKLVYHSVNRCNSNHDYVKKTFNEARFLCINSPPPTSPIKILSVPGNDKCSI
ncbi:7072_t:CDS:1, partial [Scutellospora calospora]